MAVLRPKIGLGVSIGGRSGFTNPDMFDPLTLSPYLWNNAANVTKDGSDFISSFNDLAGNGNYLTQATPSLQPQQVTNIPGIASNIIGAKFDGTDDQVTSALSLGLNAEDEWSIYTLSMFDSPEAGEFSIGGTNGGRWYRQGDKDKVRTRVGTGAFVNYTSDELPRPLYGSVRTNVIHNGVDNQYKHRHSHEPEETVNVPDGFFTNFAGLITYGAYTNTPVSQSFDGWLIEIMIFKRLLTNIEEDNLYFNYFQRMYGA